MKDRAESVKPATPVGRQILGAGRADLLGAWEGNITLPTDEEWRLMDEEIAHEMNEGPLIPGETLEETMRWLPEALAKAKSRSQRKK